jgi:dipeptidyl aminopeptidase/acylaminoacyl peptidase
MKKRNPATFLTIFALIVAFGLAPAPDLRAELPKLLPREAFLGGTTSFAYMISPDGSRLAYLGVTDKGGLGIWVRTSGKADARLVSADSGGMNGFDWAYDNRHLLFLRDSGEGNENFHLCSFDIETGEIRDLTPFKDVKAQNLQLRASRPDEILIALNRRDKRSFDMHRVSLKTFEVTLDTENPGDVRWWLADPDLVVRAAVALNPKDASTILRTRAGVGIAGAGVAGAGVAGGAPGAGTDTAAGADARAAAASAPWRDIVTWPFGETGFVEGYGSDLAMAFAPDGRSLYVQAAFKNDWTEIVRLDAATGKILETVFSDPKAPIWNILSMTLYDFAQVLFHPATGKVQAVGVDYLIPEWRVLDPDLRDDFETLKKAYPGAFTIDGRDLAGEKWIVSYYNDNRPGAYFLYDRARKTATLLAKTQTQLSPDVSAAMRGIVVKSRDGLDIPCYLTVPVGVPAKNLPLVMFIHGGPWTRDEWGPDIFVQWLANRGYAVMKVNFRGSGGFGKSFLNSGNGQWGGRMNDDVADAVKWAIREGIADPKRVAVTGGSYGGYETLAGAAFTPDLYTCAIAECGIYNVRTFVEKIPSWWEPIKTRILRRVGDVLGDDAFNRRISPYFHSDAIKARLMIIHGANDPRVNIRVADEFVDLLRKKGQDVSYIVYANEGHGLRNFANILDLLGREEEFLAKNLGGRYEPWKELKGSSAQIK